MKRQDFHYDLPDDLIAHYPSQQRTACRLLTLDGRDGAVAHRQFTQLRELLNTGDLLVFNNTRVIPARLYGQKATGGKVELLIERLLDDRTLLSQIKASKAMKPGAEFQVLDHNGAPAATFTVVGRDDSFFRIALQGEQSLDAVLAACGHMPLPPYIKREDEALDQERYQTVYAKRTGAVAAPTAGLHFDDAMIAALKDSGVNTCEVTLHVGAGTYQPVRVDDISQHKMHSEYAELDADTAASIQATHAAGKRVIAVGTTSMRCLESAAQHCEGAMSAWRGDTDIFITPGYRFQAVDALITNFHLPESTLLMLVSALAGRENIMQAYQAAVNEQYQFFSYGDAMFIQGTLPSVSFVNSNP